MADDVARTGARLARVVTKAVTSSSMVPAIAIARAHFPVTSLGFGRRVGIWMQGCHLRCAGCMSPDTWEATPESVVQIEALLNAIRPWMRHADGVTISGGEPFEQSDALAELLQRLRLETSGDLFVYSGHPWEKLRAEHARTIALCDAIMSEPFDARSPNTLPLRGSDNQRLHRLTEIGRERYGPELDCAGARARQIDVATIGERVMLVGIPKRGSHSRLRSLLHEHGFESESSRRQGNGEPR